MFFKENLLNNIGIVACIVLIVFLIRHYFDIAFLISFYFL